MRGAVCLWQISIGVRVYLTQCSQNNWINIFLCVFCQKHMFLFRAVRKFIRNDSKLCYLWKSFAGKLRLNSTGTRLKIRSSCWIRNLTNVNVYIKTLFDPLIPYQLQQKCLNYIMWCDKSNEIAWQFNYIICTCMSRNIALHCFVN